MLRLLLTLLICALAPLAFAQTPQVGHTTITFNDASRSGGFGSGGGPGRQIQSEIYYPATVAGNDVAVANGTYPVVVFGHGFVMAWDAYENVWEELVTNGYIVVFPRTEGGFSPDHNEFALDLNVCVLQTQALNTDAGSLFFGHVAPHSAIMGHSMGGGATMLAAANNSDIEAAIGLAPAETNPSAIAAAPQITVPTLVMSGSSDGVTPPADHHLPIYNALNASCKYFISVTGGAHCYFANANFNCDFGEGTASSGITVSRQDQQQVMNDYVVEWLNYQLKGDCNALGNFTSMLPNDQRITYQESCATGNLSITANGTTTFCAGESVQLDAGQLVSWSDGTVSTSITVTQSGTYFATDSASCSLSNSITVTVNPLPDVTVSQSGNMLTANQAGATYQWMDCNSNQIISGATNSSYTATSNGDYAVIVTLSGCSDTSTCMTVNSVGITEYQSTSVALLPNPAVTNVTLRSAASGSAIEHFVVYSVLGEVVFQHTPVANSYALNVQDWKSGTYFIVGRCADGSSWTARFIKR